MDKLSPPTKNEEWLTELFLMFLGLIKFGLGAFWKAWLLENELEDCLVNGEVGVIEDEVDGNGLLLGEVDGSNPWITWGPWLSVVVSIGGGFGFDGLIPIPEVVEFSGVSDSTPGALPFNETSDGFLDSTGVVSVELDSWSNFVNEETAYGLVSVDIFMDI